MQNYTDTDITFFMGLYHDHDRAEGALSRLRTHYPEARLILRSDGDNDPAYHKLADKFGAEYWQEERLYPIENGGDMITRILELFLRRPTKYYLKIDTDSAIFRRFNYLPDQSGVYGSLQTSKNGCRSIQGGFVGFSEDALRKILDSGLLADIRLKDPFAYSLDSAYFFRMSRRVNRSGLCSFDWIIGWVASELQLPMFSFKEVRCKGLIENTSRNKDLKYALTHPVYF